MPVSCERIRPALGSIVFCLVGLLLLAQPGSVGAEEEAAAPVDPNAKTIIVSAEGLADPNADIYKRDKGLMIDDLRVDAKRQAVEKAVGTYLESSTLVENYLLVNDRVLTKSKGLIKRIIQETDPWQGEDGLMHMLIKAEVFLTDVKSALTEMSKDNRLNLIKEHGNPTISVAVVVKDAERGSSVAPEGSPVAENILKEHFKSFGYRVWSEDYSKILKKEFSAKSTEKKVADFSVLGEAKFKAASVVLPASKLTITKHILTSWTVKCIDNNTGEEIYFNNKVPQNKSWTDEDRALEDIGKLVGEEFAKDFFEEQLLKPSKIYQVQIAGLPDYDTGLLFKKEFIGLRSILNVDLRNFDAKGASLYEIEFAGSRGNFAQIVNSTIINPLNAKLGKGTFKLASQSGDVVKITANLGKNPGSMQEKIKALPPTSLVGAAPERVKQLTSDPNMLAKVAAMNSSLEPSGNSGGAAGDSGKNKSIQNF